MSDNMEQDFKLFRKQRRAMMVDNICQFCLEPTPAGNNFLSCPRCFNFWQISQLGAGQNFDDNDDDDTLPPLLNIESDIRRNRQFG